MVDWIRQIQEKEDNPRPFPDYPYEQEFANYAGLAKVLSLSTCITDAIPSWHIEQDPSKN